MRTSLDISSAASFNTLQQEKERKKLMQKQEELANDQFKLKRQANLASVKNAYINLERQSNGIPTPRGNKQLATKPVIDSDDDDSEQVDQFQCENSSRQNPLGGTDDTSGSLSALATEVH